MSEGGQFSSALGTATGVLTTSGVALGAYSLFTWLRTSEWADITLAGLGPPPEFSRGGIQALIDWLWTCQLGWILFCCGIMAEMLRAFFDRPLHA